MKNILLFLTVLSFHSFAQENLTNKPTLEGKWTLVVETIGESDSKRAIKINGSEWKLILFATPKNDQGKLEIEIIDENNRLIKKSVMDVKEVLKSGELFNGNGTYFLTIKSQNVNWSANIYENINTQIAKPKEINRLQNQKIEIQEYDALPLLIFAIGGGVWSYTLFKKSSDLNDAAEIFGALNMTPLQDDAKKQAHEKQLLGIGVGAVSALLFFVSINTTTRTIEQPVSIIPTNNGLSLCIRF